MELANQLEECFASKNAKGAIRLERGALLFAETMKQTSPHIALAIFKNLACCFHWERRYVRSVELQEERLRLARDVGDTLEEARAIGGIGLSRFSMGKYADALDSLNLHLEKAQELGDRQEEGKACANLGLVYDSLDMFEKGVEFHEKDLEIARENQDQEGQERALENLGNAFFSIAEYGRAIQMYEERLAIARNHQDLGGEARESGNLGQAFGSLGQWSQAIKLHDLRRMLARNAGDLVGQGQACSKLGDCFFALGQFDKAIESHKVSVGISRKIHDASAYGRACLGIGKAYFMLGQSENAIGLYEKQRRIARTSGDRDGEANASRALGSAYIVLGEYERAIKLLEMSRLMSRGVGNRSAEATCCTELGLALLRNQNPVASSRVLVDGISLFQKIESTVALQDEWRISLFDLQQKAYMLLQSCLLKIGHFKWALAVSGQAKARALSHSLGARGAEQHDVQKQMQHQGSNLLTDTAHAEEQWELCWKTTQSMALAEGPGTCVVEYSFHFEGLAVWVVSGNGELLSCKMLSAPEVTVPEMPRQPSSTASSADTVRGQHEEVSGVSPTSSKVPLVCQKGHSVETRTVWEACSCDLCDEQGEDCLLSIQSGIYYWCSTCNVDMCEKWSQVDEDFAEWKSTPVVEPEAQTWPTGDGISKIGVVGRQRGSERHRVAPSDDHDEPMLIGEEAFPLRKEKSMGSSPECPGHHTLVQRPDAHGGGRWQCDGCGKRSKQLCVWGCGDCDFDLCDQCYGLRLQACHAHPAENDYLLRRQASSGLSPKQVSFALRDVFDGSGVCLARGGLRDVELNVSQRTVTCKRFVTVKSRHACPVGWRGYFEIEILELLEVAQVGFVAPNFEDLHVYAADGVGDDIMSWAVDGLRQRKYHKDYGPYECTWKAGDVIGLACDLVQNQILVSLNGSFDPPNGMIFDVTEAPEKLFAAFSISHGKVRYNMGEDLFRHSPPSNEFSPMRVFPDAITSNNKQDVLSFKLSECGLRVHQYINGMLEIRSVTSIAVDKHKRQVVPFDQDGSASRFSVTMSDFRAKLKPLASLFDLIGLQLTHMGEFKDHGARSQIRRLLLGAKDGMHVRARANSTSGEHQNDLDQSPDYDAEDDSDTAFSRSKGRGRVPKRPTAGSESWVLCYEIVIDSLNAAIEHLQLQDLYRVLVEPVQEHLADAETLLIIPHEELFEVPWVALTSSDSKYLIERHVIRIAPSLRVARLAAERRQETRGQQDDHEARALVVGNPFPCSLGALPNAEEEAKNVAAVLTSAGLRVHTLVREQATKIAVKLSLPGADWAHFACHGDLDTDSLVLAERAPNEHDSDLSMQEVQGDSIQNGLRLAPGATVVLSACNTGRGRINAEGVVGLTRGFLFAEASCVIASLWSVDDGSTARLMQDMYEHLRRGESVPSALRSAMLNMARPPLGEGCRPKFWAAFMAVGADTNLACPRQLAGPRCSDRG